MYLYFLRVVFTVVKVVKVSSQSFSHCFIVICMCPTKATSRDAYTRAPSFLKNAKNAPQKERRDETRDSRFSTTKKKTTIKFDASSGACATKPRKSLRLVSSFTRHVVFDFIRFSFVSLSLSFTLARLFQNRDDDDDVFVDDDDFSLVLFREDAFFTIGANERKKKNESTHHRPSGVGTDAIVLRREGRLSPREQREQQRGVCVANVETLRARQIAHGEECAQVSIGRVFRNQSESGGIRIGSFIRRRGRRVWRTRPISSQQKYQKRWKKRSRILGAHLTEICVRGGNGREKDSVDLFRGDDVGK